MTRLYVVIWTGKEPDFITMNTIFLNSVNTVIIFTDCFDGPRVSKDDKANEMGFKGFVNHIHVI